MSKGQVPPEVWDQIGPVYAAEGTEAAMVAVAELGFHVSRDNLQKHMQKRGYKAARPKPEPRPVRETGEPALDDVNEDEDRRRELRELRSLQRDEAARQRRYDALFGRLAPYAPIPYAPVGPILANTEALETFAILHVSDWHIGDQLLAEATGGLYHHNHEIARAQVEKMIRIVVSLLRDYGVPVRKLALILDGDLTEHDSMRPRQAADVEMLLADQVLATLDILVYLMHRLLELFEEVYVSSVGGNHDRLSPKPGNAGLGELGYQDTTAYILAGMLQRLFSEEPRVRVQNWKTWYGHFTIGEKADGSPFRVAHSHGADIKWTTGGHSGIPWNAIHVASQRYARMLGGYDLLFLGHGHINARIPMDPNAWALLNGSLPGTTAYVQSSFKAIRTPIQQLVVCNRHGMVAEHPLYLDVGQMTPAERIWGEEAA